MGRSKGRATILVLGLDNSGKTTVVNWMTKPTARGATEVVPSLGITEQTITVNSLQMTVCDVAGLSLILYVTYIAESCYFI